MNGCPGEGYIRNIFEKSFSAERGWTCDVKKKKNDLGKFLVLDNGARGQEWDGRVFIFKILI